MRIGPIDQVIINQFASLLLREALFSCQEQGLKGKNDVTIYALQSVQLEKKERQCETVVTDALKEAIIRLAPKPKTKGKKR